MSEGKMFAKSLFLITFITATLLLIALIIATFVGG